MNQIDTNTDDAVQSIVNLYQNASESMKIGGNRNHKTKQPFWWDDQCRTLKREKTRWLRVFRQNSSLENLNLYKGSRNKFKQVCKGKQENAQKLNRQKLVESR